MKDVIKPKLTKDLVEFLFVIITAITVFIVGFIITRIFDITVGFSFIVLLIILSYIIAPLSSAFQKIFTTYHMTDKNEIILSYKFLNRDRRVFRIDQITSVNLTRSFLEKKLGLGTISFEIFGSSQMENNQNQTSRLQKKFITITEYQEVFDAINTKIGTSEVEKYYSTKPKITPTITWLISNITLIIFAVLSYTFISNFISTNILDQDIVNIINIAALIITAGLVISSITTLISLFRLKKTTYSITKNYCEIEFNYLLKQSIVRVPIKKITNTLSYKNAISYALFKIGKVKIYTGSLYDPIIPRLEDYKKFETLLSKLIHGETLEETKEEKPSQKITTIKPSPIIIVRTFFYTFTLILIPLIILLIAINMLSLIILVVIIFFITMIIQILRWKNLWYEIYPHKIIRYSGIISKLSEEIQFKNMKYISMKKTFILDKLAKTGTIHIYTAGSTTEDKAILSHIEYKQVYNSLKNVLHEKVWK